MQRNGDAPQNLRFSRGPFLSGLAEPARSRVWLRRTPDAASAADVLCAPKASYFSTSVSASTIRPTAQQ